MRACGDDRVTNGPPSRVRDSECNKLRARQRAVTHANHATNKPVPLTRAQPRTGRECGAGSILAIAVLATIVSTLLLVAPLCRALVVRAEAAGAADAAALAAADVARGIYPGVPCVIAASVATANGARLGECRVDGVIVTVRVSVAVLTFSVTAAATAGPPFAGN